MTQTAKVSRTLGLANQFSPSLVAPLDLRTRTKPVTKPMVSRAKPRVTEEKVIRSRRSRLPSLGPWAMVLWRRGRAARGDMAPDAPAVGEAGTPAQAGTRW